MGKMKIKWTDEKIDKLRLVWTSGTTEEIRIAFSGVTNYYLRDVASRFGIKRDNKFKSKRKLVKLLDETEFNYYWLGFIMADGHLRQDGELRITLSIKDINHLNKFAEYIGIKIHVYDKQTYGKYTSNNSCNISVMDVNSVKELINRFKINGTKTYTACSLDCLNTDEKKLAFFTGLVDGDGCITQGKSGNANMLRIQCDASWINVYNKIGGYLHEKYGVRYKCYIDKRGYCKFCIYRYEDLLKLKSNICNLNIPFLERKWKKIF